MDGNYEITDLRVTGAGKILRMKVNGKDIDVVTDITKNADDEITAISINGASQEIAGGSSDIEENKAATIDVSTYTEPVEIEPTEGKDGMAKCTVTLSNIPAGGSGHIYAWSVGGTGHMYASFDVAPADQEAFDLEKVLGIENSVVSIRALGDAHLTYTRVSDTEFTMSSGGGEATTVTRDSTNDMTIW